ncbi:hypothetical protein HMPREF1548_01870 [Clostridium sp. KLE 1755]|nr:hypothetical protein HMPREF1548_01870 [Clostridium sp. KLE 1755]
MIVHTNTSLPVSSGADILKSDWLFKILLSRFFIYGISSLFSL